MSDATGTDTTTISLPADYRDAIKDGKPEHMSMGEYVYRQHEEGEVVLFDADAVAELLEDEGVDEAEERRLWVKLEQLYELTEDVDADTTTLVDRIATLERKIDALGQ